ncbi:MAG TPA: hypothetical protein VEH84_09380 [Alphaproteobacteria bacterium]|nr:hypothetical protein [Alphaproteobacteria bacterium]
MRFDILLSRLADIKSRLGRTLRDACDPLDDPALRAMTPHQLADLPLAPWSAVRSERFGAPQPARPDGLRCCR